MSAVEPKSTLDPVRCCEMVTYYHGRFYNDHTQCERRGAVTRDGKLYCKQHDPEAQASRNKLRERKYKYEQAQQVMGWYGAALYDALEASLTLRDPDPARLKRKRKALKDCREYRELLRGGPSK
jgi:hypothetical protein